MASERSSARRDPALEGGVGTWHWDVVDDILTSDRACERMVGYDMEQVPASLWAAESLVHPEDRAKRNRMFTHAAREGGHFELDYRYAHAHRGWMWVRVRGRAETDTTGRVVRCSGVMYDIDGHRALHDSEQLLRLLVAAAHDGIWDLDERTGVVAWSDGMLAMLGLRRADAPTDVDAALGFMHPDDYDAIREAIVAARAHPGMPASSSARMRDAHGDWLHVRCDTVAQVAPSGEVVRIAGLVRDVTHARLARQQRARRARDMHEAVSQEVVAAEIYAKLARTALREDDERSGEYVDQAVAQLGVARHALARLMRSLAASLDPKPPKAR